MTFAHRVLSIKVITVLVVMVLWEGLAHSGLVYSGVVPPILAVLQALLEQLLDKAFYRDLGITMLEASVGFSAGAIIALLFAVVLGTNSYIRQMIEPYIVAIGGTPKIIFLP